MQMLDAIARAQASFIAEADSHAAFNGLLNDVVALTQSAFGFIGEVLYNADQTPYLKAHAISNIAWDAPSAEVFAQHAVQGLEFRNLNTLFGHALTTGQPVISNAPATDPRRGGLPPGHPPMHAFLGIPIHYQNELVAMIGLANRPQGYDDALVQYLRPMSSTIGQLIWAKRKILEHRHTRKLLNHVLDGATESSIIATDPQGIITIFNKGAERLLGYQADEMVGLQTPLCFHVPEEVQAYAQELSHRFGRRIDGFRAFVEVALHQESDKHEWHYVRKDGSRVVVNLTVTAMQDEDERIVGFLGIAEDITERKHAENQLRQAANVFAHANEGILITDKFGTIVDVNAAFCRITGYPREEVLGQKSKLLRSSDEIPGLYRSIQHALQTKGEWRGEIWNRRKNGDNYAELVTISAVRDARGEVLHFVALYSDITSIKEHQLQLERMAHYDALTQLPNRVLLADRLRQAMLQAERRQSLLAIAYLDLDGFKEINDLHGHETGDKLLSQLSARLKLSLREGDTLARLGGDEFVAVLLDLHQHDDSLPVLDRLLSAAGQPVVVDGLELRVSASIGVTFYPQSAEQVDGDQLLRQADQAMYQAKQAGKCRYHLFDTEKDRAVRGFHESIERIREALHLREFVLHYQPKVNMRTGEVIGAEALIRWQHPQRGLLSPATFLPVIENHVLNIAVGEWVVEAALEQIETWRHQNVHLPVSVNIDAMHLQQPGFTEHLRQRLRQHPGVAPGDLQLEVLESSALQDIHQVSQTLELCRDMGVSVALDDFGTGYSSLTYLKRLPAEQLKIDQSFVRDMLDDPDDLAILDGVLGLAKAFQRQAIAEGVETLAHGELLLQMGCDLGQGYAIARPMPAADLTQWLRTWRPDASWLNRPRIKRDGLPLLYAMIEHRSWVSMLEKSLKNEISAVPTMNPHRCRFGQWLDTAAQGLYGHHTAMPRIVDLHEAIHQRAHALLTLKQRGFTDMALEDMGEIRAMRDELLNCLQNLLLEHSPN